MGFPVKSTMATSLVGIVRSSPLTRMLNPTRAWSKSCPEIRSPERRMSVAFSWAKVGAAASNETADNTRIVRLNIFISPCLDLVTEQSTDGSAGSHLVEFLPRRCKADATEEPRHVTGLLDRK